MLATALMQVASHGGSRKALRRRESSGVGGLLERAPLDEQAAHVDDERRDPEQHGQEQREHDDDLAALRPYGVEEAGHRA